MKIIWLRIFHGLATLYFSICLLLLYYTAYTGQPDAFFYVAFISLALEGIAVYVFNKGDCPLIHVQRKIGDDKPFFELFLPPRLAKKAMPIFGCMCIVALGCLAVRLAF